VRLAIRARSTGFTAADIERALTEERSLVVTWLNRGTLHLVCSEDYPWLQPLTTPRLLTLNARRLSQEGVTPSLAERGVAVIERCLAEEGPLNRAQLGERIASADVPTKGQALVHVLMLAALRGLTVRGPIIDGEHAYVLVRDWLGEPEPVDRDRALGALARRYLAGHGPAGERDLAKWAGLTLRDARAGLIAIASALDVRADGLVDLASRAAAAPLPPPRCAACEPHPPRAATRDQLRTGPRAGPPSPPRCDATRPCAFPFPPFPPAVQPTWRWTLATPLTWPRWS